MFASTIISVKNGRKRSERVRKMIVQGRKVHKVRYGMQLEARAG